MANSYSIIIEYSGAKFSFTPDLDGATSGQPLGVNQFDNITWNNRTDFTITLTEVAVEITPATPPISPAPVIVPTNYLTDQIAAGRVSNPIFNVAQNAGTTISYSATAAPGGSSTVLISSGPWYIEVS